LSADRYGMLALVKCGNQIESTSIVSLTNEQYLVSRRVLFDDVIEFGHLLLEFNVEIEMFVLVRFDLHMIDFCNGFGL